MLFVIAWDPADHRVHHVSGYDDAAEAAEEAASLQHELHGRVVDLYAAQDLDDLRRRRPDLAWELGDPVRERSRSSFHPALPDPPEPFHGVKEPPMADGVMRAQHDSNGP